MKSRLAQYLNEIVSITIMILMAVALIGGQMNAGAVAENAAKRADYIVVVAPGND